MVHCLVGRFSSKHQMPHLACLLFSRNCFRADQGGETLLQRWNHAPSHDTADPVHTAMAGSRRSYQCRRCRGCSALVQVISWQLFKCASKISLVCLLRGELSRIARAAADRRHCFGAASPRAPLQIRLADNCGCESRAGDYSHCRMHTAFCRHPVWLCRVVIPLDDARNCDATGTGGRKQPQCIWQPSLHLPSARNYRAGRLFLGVVTTRHSLDTPSPSLALHTMGMRIARREYGSAQ